MKRRDIIKWLAAAPALSLTAAKAGIIDNKENRFRYCLNTSTISGQNPGLIGYIEIAGKAGYDGVELWIRDIQGFLTSGGRLSDIQNALQEYQLKVEGAIGFAPWMSPDEQESKAGFIQMQEEMELLASLDCPRIAAPAAGVNRELDLFRVGEKYRLLLDLGRKTGVMPQLEFWGSSPWFYHMGQALMVCAVANDPDARILTDVYHMYRGGSGYDTLGMLPGHMIEIFHMNDFPGDIPRASQTDADRVYPGDGAAPVVDILQRLHVMGGEKVLSLELFNRSYWEQDALEVARTGLRKMRSLTAKAMG